MIDAYWSLRHYADHIRPVFDALPPAIRGTAYTPETLRHRDHSRPVIVASYRDAEAVAPSPYVLVEHGAGQTYEADGRSRRNPSYSGGDGHERCLLFLCPSERVAERWRARYDAPAAVVGSPRLDRWGQGASTARCCATPAAEPGSSRHPAPAPVPIVAVTFHADLAVCPETRTAWHYYDAFLPRLCADPRWRVVGHGHPRLWPTIRRRWQQLGVAHSPDPDEVLAQADVLVMDNTTLGYDAAALGIPVVCLNIPAYRRDVEHGLRFWSAPPGVQVDHPAELPDAIMRALADPPALRAIRERAALAAYDGLVDGKASERAAAAILEVL